MWPQTRKEISSIGWIRLIDLPGYSKRNKDSQLGIKLYMVTPFLAGLRKWINQNRHLKRMLAPVEEDAGEDSMQEDVVQNGTTSELIAMLRRRQQAEVQQQRQEHQATGQRGVDLLGMLRNGAPPTQQPTVTQYQEQYQQPIVPAPRPFDPNTQSGDLLQFSPIVRPVLNDAHESIPPPGESSTPVIHPSLPTDERRSSLLSILKGAPVNVPVEAEPSGGPKIEDILQLTGIPLEAAMPNQPAVDPSSTEHQRSLLSLLKSPKISSSVPETTMAPSSPHQNALLAALKSPRVPCVEPPVPPKEISRTVPCTLTQSAPSTTHQNASLTALKYPMAPDHSPVGKQLEALESTSDQNALLSTLKGPSKVSKIAKPIKAPTNHQLSLLNALKSSSSGTSSPQRSVETDPSSTLASKLPPKSPPPPPSPITTSARQAYLLSTLKSPTLPPTSIESLDALKNSPVQNDYPSSLLSKLKGAPKEVTTEEPQDVGQVKKGQGKNVHMEALLKSLTSPSASPLLKHIQTAPTKTPPIEPSQLIAPPAVSDEKLIAPAEALVQTAPSGSKQVPSHVNSLLLTLKGAKSSSPPPTAPSPTKASLLSALTGSKSTTPDESNPSKSSSPPAVANPPKNPSPPALNAQMLLETLKSPKLNGVKSKPNSPSPPPPTSRQRSLLSLFNSASPTQSPKSPQTQQPNVSLERQVGKSMKFRDIPVSDRVDQGLVNATPAKSIDLSKVKFLKRPTNNKPPEAPQVATSPMPTTSDEESGKLRQTTTAVPAISEMPARRKASLESGLDSPLGIEFPFRKRTPRSSSRASPSPGPTPLNPNAQSLLAILKGPIPKSDVIPERPATETVQSEIQEGQEKSEENGVETMATETEMKLIAMLERALARGVPS